MFNKMRYGLYSLMLWGLIAVGLSGCNTTPPEKHKHDKGTRVETYPIIEAGIPNVTLGNYIANEGLPVSERNIREIGHIEYVINKKLGYKTILQMDTIYHENGEVWDAIHSFPNVRDSAAFVDYNRDYKICLRVYKTKDGKTIEKPVLGKEIGKVILHYEEGVLKNIEVIKYEKSKN